MYAEEDEIRHFYELSWVENEKTPARHWNGHQIKNAFQTAMTLLHWDLHEGSDSQRIRRPVLQAKHFKRIG